MFIRIVTLVLLWTFVSGFTKDDCPANVRDKYTQVYGNKCYRFVVYQTANYRSAKAHCVKKGGNLATIKSKFVNTFVNARLRFVYGLQGTAWIGLNDIEVEGTFKWEDGASLNYTNFLPGEGPTRVFSALTVYEDCVVINTNKNGKWQDVSCSESVVFLGTRDRNFVCEFSVIE